MKTLPRTVPSVVASEIDMNTQKFMQDLLDALREAQQKIVALEERVTELETP